MQQQPVSKLLPSEKFDGFLLVRSAEQRFDSKGKKYLDMNLADRTGEINCKRWDENAMVPAQGSIVWVTGSVQEFKGRIQMKIDSMHLRTPIETVDYSMLIPCAPEKPEAMVQEIEDTIASFQSEDLKKIVRRMIQMTREKLLYYPAAMRKSLPSAMLENNCLVTCHRHYPADMWRQSLCNRRSQHPAATCQKSLDLTGSFRYTRRTAQPGS